MNTSTYNSQEIRQLGGSENSPLGDGLFVTTKHKNRSDMRQTAWHDPLCAHCGASIADKLWVFYRKWKNVVKRDGKYFCSITGMPLGRQEKLRACPSCGKWTAFCATARRDEYSKRGRKIIPTQEDIEEVVRYHKVAERIRSEQPQAS